MYPGAQDSQNWPTYPWGHEQVSTQGAGGASPGWADLSRTSVRNTWPESGEREDSELQAHVSPRDLPVRTCNQQRAIGPGTQRQLLGQLSLKKKKESNKGQREISNFQDKKRTWREWHRKTSLHGLLKVVNVNQGTTRAPRAAEHYGVGVVKAGCGEPPHVGARM